nr:serine/arginine-rich splicing factor SR45-like [Aegilops tauschii subsp. strangulata]
MSAAASSATPRPPRRPSGSPPLHGPRSPRLARAGPDRARSPRQALATEPPPRRHASPRRLVSRAAARSGLRRTARAGPDRVRAPPPRPRAPPGRPRRTPRRPPLRSAASTAPRRASAAVAGSGRVG